jgi:chromosome segregation ATPase
MSDTNTGFDPSVVAQFFRTLEEFRSGNAEFQRQLLATVNDLREDIKELRKEIQDVRQQLADGNRTFGIQDQQISAIRDWEKRKEEECRRHQEETRALREEMLERERKQAESLRQAQKETQTVQNEMRELKAAGTGIGMMWKVIIGAVGLLVSVTGLLVAWKIVGRAAP